MTLHRGMTASQRYRSKFTGVVLSAGGVHGIIEIDLPRPRTSKLRGLHAYTDDCQAVRDRLEAQPQDIPTNPLTNVADEYYMHF